MLSIQCVRVVAGNAQVPQHEFGQALATVTKEQDLQILYPCHCRGGNDPGFLKGSDSLQHLLFVQRQRVDGI